MIPTGNLEDAPDSHPEHQLKDASDLAAGRIPIASLPVKEHHTVVFDLMDEEQREEYDRLYVALSSKAREGKIVISTNVRETLSSPDGGNGWYKLLEWSEFDVSGIIGA